MALPFKMAFNKEEMAGRQPVPEDWYKLRFVGFNPQISKKGDSLNFNMEFEVINTGDDKKDGHHVFFNANTIIPGWIQDAVHGLGMEMVELPDGSFGIPGKFDADPANYKEEDPNTWVYKGPLTGRVTDAELFVTEYQGRRKNEINQFKCAVKDCAVKNAGTVEHATRMVKKA